MTKEEILEFLDGRGRQVVAARRRGLRRRDPEDVGRQVLQEGPAGAVRRLRAPHRVTPVDEAAGSVCWRRPTPASGGPGSPTRRWRTRRGRPGVSRATVYRWFPGGREQLLNETIAWQTDQFFVRLAAEVDPAGALPGRRRPGAGVGAPLDRRARGAAAPRRHRARARLLPGDHPGGAAADPGDRPVRASRGSCGRASTSRRRRGSTWPAWSCPTSPRPAGGTSRTPAQVERLVQTEILAGVAADGGRLTVRRNVP